MRISNSFSREPPEDGMCVRIDQSRHHNQVGGFDHLGFALQIKIGRYLGVRTHPDDVGSAANQAESWAALEFTLVKVNHLFGVAYKEL